MPRFAAYDKIAKGLQILSNALGNEIQQLRKDLLQRRNIKVKTIYYQVGLVRNWYCLDIEYTNHMNSYKFQIHVTAVEFE